VAVDEGIEVLPRWTRRRVHVVFVTDASLGHPWSRNLAHR